MGFLQKYILEMKRLIILLGVFISGLIAIQSCIVIENKFNAIPPGEWRGILLLEGEKTKAASSKILFEEVSKGELPFTFEVVYETPDSFYIIIHNAEERIEVRDITFGRIKGTERDSIRINFPVFDTYITALYEEDVIEGTWVVNNREENYRVPFKAFHGKNYRFTELKKTPTLDLTGRWETYFELETEKPYPAIGEFKQEGNYLTGTFQTETGDYRYLEGTIQNDKAYLSCFDGSHAFLFEAKVLADSSLTGAFYSGIHYKTVWEARRNENFKLGNPDTLTYLKDPLIPFDFKFKNTEGREISLSEYENKVKIVQLMGTWCPNCKDQTEFLLDYKAKVPNDKLAIVSLAFERYKEEAPAMAAIKRYKEKMGVKHEVLLAGYHEKIDASKALPMLNQVIAYPTMLFLDKENRIRRIYTGFYGPATSEFAAFEQDFNQFMANLLAE